MNYPDTLVQSLSKIDKERVSELVTIFSHKRLKFRSKVIPFRKETRKQWEFNVFQVSEASKQRPLTYVLYELLKKYGLLSTFKVMAFHDFFVARLGHACLDFSVSSRKQHLDTNKRFDEFCRSSRPGVSKIQESLS